MFEHVLEPNVVIKEIVRVLVSDGIVYSETPFMQQVHEANFDFTRFTHSGHRLLFKNFKEINSGIAMGMGVQILWTVENVARGIFRSSKMGRIILLLFFWLRFIEYLIPESRRFDSSSSFYFLGKKDNQAFNKKNIIDYYRGGL